MAVDFKMLLARNPSDAKRPPTLPAGTYYGVITAFKFQESKWDNQDTGDKDAQVRYTIKNLEPGEDIQATPQLLEGIDLAKRQTQADLPLSGGNEYVTKMFLESLGITAASWGEACPEAQGKAVMFDGVQRMNKNDPSAPFFDVRNLRARPA
jgi:hypothetical protein